MKEEILSLNWLSKSYQTNKVLKYINLNVFEGEIFAVIGQNAVGKSTLLKIISGYISPTSGDIYFKEQKVTLKNHFDALALGIYSIESTIEIIPDMSVFENVYLGLLETRSTGFFYSKRTALQKVQKMIESLNLTLSPNEPGYMLSALEKYYIEIIRAKLNHTRLLLIDEPFITLNDTETNQLKQLLLQLISEGISIIFTSHKIPDINKLADRICLLKSGKSSVILENNRSYDKMEELLVGLLSNKDSNAAPTPVLQTPTASELLRVENFKIPDYINNLSFTLYEGEILGITGLDSPALTCLADALWGLTNSSEGKPEGQIYLEGKPVTIENPRQALKHKIAYMSDVESSHPQIIHSLSILNNLTLPFLNRISPGPLIQTKTESYLAEEFKAFLPAEDSNWKTTADHLSYGVEKKLALARWFCMKHKVLILNEPLNGLDLDSRAQIIAQLQKLAAEGTSIIVKSVDFEDIIACTGRTLVINNGELQGELRGTEMTANNILVLALQNKQEGDACTDY